jgi:hypothetical protein
MRFSRIQNKIIIFFFSFLFMATSEAWLSSLLLEWILFQGKFWYVIKLENIIILFYLFFSQDNFLLIYMLFMLKTKYLMIVKPFFFKISK